MNQLIDTFKQRWAAARDSPEGGRSFWSAIGLIGSSLAAVVAVAISARRLGTAEYGVYAGMLALVGLAATFGSMGANQIMLQRVTRDRKELPFAWGVLLAANAVVGIPLLAITIAASSVLLSGRDLTSIALIATAEYVSSGLLMGPAAAWVGLDRFPIVASVNILNATLRLVAALSLLIWTPEIRTLATAQLVLMVLGALVVNTALRRVAGRPRLVRSELIEACRKGAPYSVANVSTSIQGNIDQFMLVRARLDVEAGLYAAGVRFMSYSMLPLNALTSAMVPDFFRRGHEGVSSGLRYAKTKLKIFIGLSLSGACVAIVMSNPLGRLFGDRFSEVLPVMLALSLFPLVRSIQTLVRTALLGSGHQVLVARTNMVTAALNVILNIFLIPAFGWQGAVAATYVSEMANLGFLYIGAHWLSEDPGRSPGPGLTTTPS